ncbi:MAG: 3-hydroxyacyl-ACP dehydratase [Caldimonas sp.]
MTAPTPIGATVTHRFRVAPDHPAFDGHFPGQPMLPGVALLAEVLEAARAEPTLAQAIGSEPRLVVTKFLVPVLPGISLTIAFSLGTKTIDWRIDDDAAVRAVASGQIARADASGEMPP